MMRPWWFGGTPVVDSGPPDSANIVLWFDATTITPQTDDTAISQWDDLSANAYHVTQATAAKKPHYRTAAGAGAINGLPTVDFARTQAKKMESTAGNPLAGGAARTIYVVGRDSAAGDAPGTLIGFRKSGLQFVAQCNYGPSYVFTDAVNAGNNATIVQAVGDTDVPFVFTWRCAGTGNKIEVWLNATSKTVTQGGSCPTETGNTGFVLGNRQSPDQGWMGVMGEVLVYAGAHDSATRTLVWDYLNAKWGL